jgi:hypothetical protein
MFFISVYTSYRTCIMRRSDRHDWSEDHNKVYALLLAIAPVKGE